VAQITRKIGTFSHFSFCEVVLLLLQQLKDERKNEKDYLLKRGHRYFTGHYLFAAQGSSTWKHRQNASAGISSSHQSGVFYVRRFLPAIRK
jgi:hypothetical protein